MSESKQPSFLVSAETELVSVQVFGKANYLNCKHFREFIESMLKSGKKEIQINFSHCNGMDSTFLGILAGCALRLNDQTPPGRLSVCQLSERNRELITNLGLQALLHLVEDAPERKDPSQLDRLENKEVDDAAEVLHAHENLIQANSANAAKFEDVISFLKKQVEDDAE